MQAAHLTLLLLLVAGSWTRAQAAQAAQVAGGKRLLPVARERLRDPAVSPAAAAGRGRRGVNVRLVAAVGPPLYLTQAEYGLGYGRVQRADAAVHVQDEDDSDQLVEVEESPLRGGAMWSLARFMLFSFMCTLATGMAVCFAKQITATYRALRTFCCLCVGRVGRGGDSEKADKPAPASKPTPNDDSKPDGPLPTPVLNRTAEGVGEIPDTKVPRGNRAPSDFVLLPDAGAGRPRPLRGHRESMAGGVVSSVGAKPRASQDGTSNIGSRDPALRPPPTASRLSARSFSRVDLTSRGARRQAGTSPPARASPRMTSLRPAKSKPPRRSARPDRLEDTVDLLCLSASASSQETLFDARLGRGGH